MPESGGVQSHVSFGNCYALAGLGTLNLSTSDGTSSHTACACLLHLPLDPLSRWLHPHFREEGMGPPKGPAVPGCLRGGPERKCGRRCVLRRVHSFTRSCCDLCACVCFHSCTCPTSTAISASAPAHSKVCCSPRPSPRPYLRMSPVHTVPSPCPCPHLCLPFVPEHLCAPHGGPPAASGPQSS